MKLLDESLSVLTVLPFCREASLKYGQTRADLINKGQDIGFADTAIAAIALTENMPVLTANTNHFNRIEELEVMEFSL